MNRGGRGERRRSRSRSPRRGRPNASSRNDRMVYITNIAYEVRWVELKNLVREKGGEVVFVELLEDRNGKPKGNAVVEFETREGAHNCIENLNRFELKGRNIIAKEIRDPIAFFRGIKEETGIDFLAKTGGSGRGQTQSESERPARSGTYELFGLNVDFLRQLHIEPPLCDRVFVANLSFNVGTDRIYEIFGMAGKIVWMDFRIDKEGRTKGVCVIQFSHPIEAVQAVSMFNNQKLYDRTMAVKMDRFEKFQADSENKEGGLPKGLESMGMGLGANGAPLANVAAVFGASTTPTREAQSLYGGGIGGGIGSSLAAGMAVGGAQSAAVPNSFMNQSGMGVGGYDSFSRNVGIGNGAPSVGSYNSQSFGGQSSYDYGKKEPFSQNQQSYASSRVIIIRNLPPDYTWQIVRDRVRQFAEVETVDIVSPGVARLRFATIQDAERARAALIGTSVEGRIIAVEYTTTSNRDKDDVSRDGRRVDEICPGAEKQSFNGGAAAAKWTIWRIKQSQMPHEMPLVSHAIRFSRHPRLPYLPSEAHNWVANKAKTSLCGQDDVDGTRLPVLHTTTFSGSLPLLARFVPTPSGLRFVYGSCFLLLLGSQCTEHCLVDLRILVGRSSRKMSMEELCASALMHYQQHLLDHSTSPTDVSSLPYKNVFFPMPSFIDVLSQSSQQPKPQHSYIGLIAMAILSSPNQKMVLSEVYDWIMSNYPYFRTRGAGWRNSIRHNLSLNDCFVKAGRAANGKGHYWAVHPACVNDFARGDFRRRRAQRKVRRHMGLAVIDGHSSDSSPSCSPRPTEASLNFYSPFTEVKPLERKFKSFTIDSILSEQT
ncbi:unnamed protein product [Caenorhabditis auriculariae]|uniref:Uncharacterized protein n=1 Tax=Caenorhabditis auriculariae TaxID=2777116 RepID=A0A8S1GPS3_9PELO|nr:unnamed protein product [Caenorhabditis auriculariae]